MWNGLRTQEALEGGVFSRRGFLHVGTEENPCPYDNKVPDRDAFKGKQFSTQATKTSKVPKDFFDPVVKPLFEGEAYVDRLAYHELQPEKPAKGFMTSDFSKRDEFTLTLRAEQLRQQIKHETHVQKLAAQKLAARVARSGAACSEQQAAAEQQQAAKKKEAPLLFDLVYEGEAELCLKAKQDTRNPTALSKERRMGTFKTTNIVHQSAVLAKNAAPPAASLTAEAETCQHHGKGSLGMGKQGAS